MVAADEEQLGLVEHAGGKGVAVGKFLLQFLRGEDGGVHFAAKLLLGFACHGLIENSNPQFLHARLYRRTETRSICAVFGESPPLARVCRSLRRPVRADFDAL